MARARTQKEKVADPVERDPKHFMRENPSIHFLETRLDLRSIFISTEVMNYEK